MNDGCSAAQVAGRVSAVERARLAFLGFRSLYDATQREAVYACQLRGSGFGYRFNKAAHLDGTDFVDLTEVGLNHKPTGRTINVRLSEIAVCYEVKS
jgi:hypothetical protein